MEVEFKTLTISEGYTPWGAEPRIKYFVLGLGKIISTTNCDLKLPSCDVLSQRNDSEAAVCGKCEMLGYLGPCDEHYHKGMAVFD